MLAVIGSGLLMGGCVVVESSPPEDDFEGPMCTLILKPSLALTVRDERGADLCDATVTVREGPHTWQLESSDPAGPTCFWSGLDERPGNYEITASRPGYETVVRSNVVVSEELSGCHVKTAQVDMQLRSTLPPGACYLLAAQSFSFDIRDELGRAACDAAVTVRNNDTGAVTKVVAASNAPDFCDWQGPIEEAGTFDVTIAKPGYDTITFNKVVVTKDYFPPGAKDDCGPHVRTAKIDAQLQRTGPVCDAILVEPFDLDVRDENFAEVCDAQVSVLEKGAVVATLVPHAAPDGDCQWTGGPSRAGTFDLQIDKAGYLSSKVSDVGVKLDATGCHPVPVLVNVKLDPAPSPTGG